MNESQIVLKVIPRETGKKATNAVRKKGLVPGIFYMKSGENIPFAVEPLDLRPVVYTSQIKIVNLEIDGYDDARECILKSIDFDPVTDKIVHLDLYGIIRGQKMTIEVPIILIGSAMGLREGGVLQHTLRKVEIQCFPKDLPNSIEIDISDMNIGNTVYVKDIKVSDFEILVAGDYAIASIVQPRVITEDEVEVEGIELQEGEISEDGKEEGKEEKSE